MAYEQKYMELAIELAKRGEGAVNPNPLVGAVIVKNGKVIGQGYHTVYGSLHAEREAIASLKESACGAEMYVTLEPCCHFGKQPPCTYAIVENKISTVYVGSDDPNEKVAGKGIQYLKEHGVQVITGCMKEECDAINEVFFHYITNKTPYVDMKYAMTLDGKIATRTGASQWISNEASRAYVQSLRNKYTGIMVGIGTVLKDNPMLNCRLENGRNPVRIVCDTNLRIPVESRIAMSAGDIKTIVAVDEKKLEYPAIKEKQRELERLGLEIMPVCTSNGHIDLRCLMRRLGEKEIDGILLEGGGQLNYSALESGIVNKVTVFIAPKIFGGEAAPSAVGGLGVANPEECFGMELTDIKKMDDDIMLTYKRQTGV